MSWDFCTTTTPKARKEYSCDAARLILYSSFGEIDFTPEEWSIIKKAEAEKWKVKKGDTYIKCRGMYDGEFVEFKARIDLDKICVKYGFYGD